MSQRAFRSLVLGYAHVHRLAVQKQGIQWERGVDWLRYRAKLEQDVRDLYLQVHASGRKKARAASRRVRKAEGDIFFGEASPEAVSWAQTRAAQFVSNVDTSVKEAIRAYVSQAVQEGVPARSLAKQLEGVVGLRPDQADALEKIRTQLIEEGRDQGEIDRLLMAKGERMLSQRATLIARTELTAAQNQGALMEWSAQKAAGDLPDTSVREWIAGQENQCEICESLDGKHAKMEKQFHSDVSGAQYWGPPAHPGCRCSAGIAVLEPEEYARV